MATIVEECSDTDQVPKPPWKQRKQAYVDHLEYASKATLLVSLADKLDNARAILRDHRSNGPAVWQRFSENDPREHLWYYRSLLAVYQKHQDGWLVGELKRVLDELEARVDAEAG